MEKKFYMVVGPAGKPIYAYNAVDYDKAERAAKKAAVESRDDVFIMTSTQLVSAPAPEASVAAIQ